MSEQKHTPGTGIHPEDMNALTEKWLRDTNHLNDSIDAHFKSAQDDAYAKGYRRGREDLIAIRKQRDELLAALDPDAAENIAREAFQFALSGGNIADLYKQPERMKLRAAISSVKGGAA